MSMPPAGFHEVRIRLPTFGTSSFRSRKMAAHEYITISHTLIALIAGVLAFADTGG
jgi:hypothetical protein